MNDLITSSEFRTSQGNELMDALISILNERGTVTREAQQFVFHCDDFRATCFSAAQCTTIELTAPDWRRLALAKATIATHLRRAPGGLDLAITWNGDRAGEHALGHVQKWSVLANRHVTPRVRRISFKVEDASLYNSPVYHVRLLLPRTPGVVFDWPMACPAGLPVWPHGEAMPILRTYTIRAVRSEQHEIDVDFVMHQPNGPASSWASSCEAGDIIGALGPVGRPIRATQNRLLIGDETALPAIMRTLETSSAGNMQALIEVANCDETQPIAAIPGASVRWLYRDRADGPSLTDAVRECGWCSRPSVFTYAGLEFEPARRLRTLLTEYFSRDKRQFLSIAYWRAAAQRAA
jgi:NADPH-dependent ferric siderophore reductase